MCNAGHRLVNALSLVSFLVERSLLDVWPTSCVILNWIHGCLMIKKIIQRRAMLRQFGAWLLDFDFLRWNFLGFCSRDIIISSRLTSSLPKASKTNTLNYLRRRYYTYTHIQIAFLAVGFGRDNELDSKLNVLKCRITCNRLRLWLGAADCF